MKLPPPVTELPGNTETEAAEELYIYFVEGRLQPGTPIREKGFLGNWEEEETSFLFFDRPSRGAVDRLLARQPHLRFRDRYRMSYSQWQGETSTPFDAGPFTVLPPGHPDPPRAERLPLRIDPGLVFGSGHHPTTRTCLEVIGRLPCQGANTLALDLGCGSGLLALAAARLGYLRVLALDFNRLAVQTTRGNIAQNGLERHVLAIQGRAEDFFHLPAELVTANLHWDVMQRLLGARLLANKGWLVLSGLLRGEAGPAAILLEQQGARILERLSPDGVWLTLVARGGA